MMNHYFNVFLKNDKKSLYEEFKKLINEDYTE